MIQPNRMMATAMPMKPAVIRRKSAGVRKSDHFSSSRPPVRSRDTESQVRFFSMKRERTVEDYLPLKKIEMGNTLEPAFEADVPEDEKSPGLGARSFENRAVNRFKLGKEPRPTNFLVTVKISRPGK